MHVFIKSRITDLRRAIFVLIPVLFLLLSACNYVPASWSNRMPQPTPDLQPTVEALVNLRLQQIQNDAAVEVEVQKIISEMLTPTPKPIATPTVVPRSTPAPTPTHPPMPTRLIDKDDVNKAIADYLEGLVPSVYPEHYKGSVHTSSLDDTRYVGAGFWTAQSIAKLYAADKEATNGELVTWYVHENGGSPLVTPGDDAAKEWDSFLRGRPELVDWVQLTYCLIKEDGKLIDEWNKASSTFFADFSVEPFYAKVYYLRGQQETISNRLWGAPTPKLGREIRDTLIRYWDKSIAHKDGLLLIYINSTTGNSLARESLGDPDEIAAESDLIRLHAVESLFDLVEIYELWEYDATCPSENNSP